MSNLFVKFIMVIISAVMNIVGAFAIPSIGTGAITMLVIWNLCMCLVVADNHKRAENREKSLREKIDHWMIKARKEQIKNIEREEDQK